MDLRGSRCRYIAILKLLKQHDSLRFDSPSPATPRGSRNSFSALLLTLWLLTIAVGQYVPAPVTVSRKGHWSKCDSDCAQFCPDAREGKPYERCTYTRKHRNCAWGIRKRCECKCERRTELEACMEVVLAGKNHAGTYVLTSDSTKNKPVYVRQSDEGPKRYLFFTGTVWGISDRVPGPRFHKNNCRSRDLNQCKSFGFTCKTLYRSDGRCGPSYMSEHFPQQPAICNPASDKPCCSATGTCGGDTKSCHCATTSRNSIPKCMNWASVRGSCTYEQVLGKKNPDLCEITPVDTFDKQVKEQQLWNMATLLSNVPDTLEKFKFITSANPLFGLGIDTFFALMDPHSPIDTQHAIGNTIVNAFNEKVKQLQECFDERIETAKTDVFRKDGESFWNEAEIIRAQSVEDRVDLTRNLWVRLAAKMKALFEDTAISTTAFKNMLPMYTSMHQLTQYVITERLQHLVAKKECETYEVVVNRGIALLKLFERWADVAVSKFIDELTPPKTDYSREKCTKSSRGFTHNYVIGNEKHLKGERKWDGGVTCKNRLTQDIKVTMAMTKRTHDGPTCTFDITAGNFCGPSDQQVCDAISYRASQFAKTLRARLDDEYRSKFVDEYIEPVRLFRKSLEDVLRGPGRKKVKHCPKYLG